MNPTTPAAQKSTTTFRMEVSVRVTIQARPERVWGLLTDAAGIPRWNSTVTTIEGTIAPGERLKLTVPAAPGRVFSPKVTAFVPGRSMEWSDGMAPMFRGVRTFDLEEGPNGSTKFSMREAFSGLMLPMIKGSLPDFVPVFEAYAADLKREAERGA